MNLLDLILENQVLFNLLSEEGRVDVLKSKFVDSKIMEERTFNQILEADPTANKSYSQWILNQYVKEVVKPFSKSEKDTDSRPSQEAHRARRVFMEDLEGLREALLLFDKYKKKFPEKDINKYSITQLMKDSLDVSDSLSDAEKSVVSGQHRFAADESKFPEYKIGEVSGFTVWKLPEGNDKAETAACELGKDTSWCTRQGSFKTYSKKDPLYVFIGRGTKYQFHFSDNQFMNRANMQMPEGPLKDSFLEFLEKYEGRVTREKSLDQYKVGEYDTPSGKLNIYKVGKDKYYTKIAGREIFYNPDTGLLKTKDGKTISDPGVILTHPYMDFLEEIYRRLKEEGDTKGFRGVYRLLLNLDVPDKGPDHWWTIPGSLDLRGSELTELPEGLHIQGDLLLDDSSIKKLPKRIKVDGEIEGLE